MIAAVAMDVDGVLTDGTVLIDAEGRESKALSFADIMGVSLARRAGLRLALVSGENGPLLRSIAAKLGVSDVYGGCRDKAEAVRGFAARHGIPLGDVCFVGDDVNDLPAFAVCGLAVAPRTAHESALAKADRVTEHAAGAGAVREILDALLRDRAAAPDSAGTAT